MFTYALRRILTGLFIVWGVYTLTFFAVNLAPGDPFTTRENPKVQEEDLARLRARWGYDRPVLERYLLHMRKMFWADAELLDAEGGGLSFDVRGEGDRNVVSARVQEPPETLRLQPVKRVATDVLGSEVVLRRGPEGWGPEPIAKGRYQVGVRFLVVGDSPVRIDASGLAVKVEGGMVSASPARTEPPPERITLERAGGEPLVLLRGADGVYGPLPVPSDAYTYQDAFTATPVTLAVPPEALASGGLTFDLGTSILNKTPVWQHLRKPLLHTLILATAALLVQFVAGVLLGVLSAVRRGSLLDRELTFGTLFVYSMPGFWLAVMLQLLLSVRLGWLPVSGMHGEGRTDLLDLLSHLVMPVIVLGLGGAAATARYQRSAMLEVLSQDFVRTARAKGLTERSVIWKHAFRNALLPTITLLGLSLPFLVSGSVITEQVFSWPGMGREAITAIQGRDVSVVTGITLIATVMVVVGSLLADILYAYVDPRVRLS
jgi:peptide/nickel transport system permease protein